MAKHDVCEFCETRLALYELPAQLGDTRAWLCPECDGEHARELQHVPESDERRCWQCNTYPVCVSGLCDRCARSVGVAR
jgi:hypothetical protein